MYQLMLLLLKRIKKPNLIWEKIQKYVCIRFFLLFFECVCYLKFVNKILQWNPRVRGHGKFVRLSCFLNYDPFSFPSPGKYSARYLSWRTWGLCFRTDITSVLVETYKQKAGSSISGWLRKDTFSPWPLGLTVVSLSTSYIFFCVEEPWTSKESQAKEGFAGCGKSRSLVPHNWRKLPTWLVINSLNWQDVKMKVYK